MDAETAASAKAAVWPRVAGWLDRLLDYPGFREWKSGVARRQILFTLLPQAPVEPYRDFEFDEETLRQHGIVSGYVGLVGAAADCRMTRHYFRRYPFRGLPVARNDHLRTCCELYFSRVFQFRERLFRLLAWIARRTEPKRLDVDALRSLFEAQLRDELEQRNRIHHEAGYSDFELDALRQNDLLSMLDVGHPRMSEGGYRRIARDWQRRVDATSDKLDLWVGLAAVLLLVRCGFLVDGGEDPPP